MKKIKILDTTLRDGELSDGVAFTTDDKIAIASHLAAIGVDVIEVAVAGSASDPMKVVRAISARVRTSVLCVLAPLSIEAIDSAADALQDTETGRIHLYHGASIDPETLARVESLVRRAASHVREVEFSPMNAARAPLDAVASTVSAALRGGATVINIADTAGRALPDETSRRMSDLYERVSGLADICVSFHGHNDLGLATANSLAAVGAGAGQIEVAVNGLGERAGNTALEELVAALSTRGGTLRARTGVDLDGMLALSRLVEERSGIPVSAQKAVVGRNARWK